MAVLLAACGNNGESAANVSVRASESLQFEAMRDAMVWAGQRSFVVAGFTNAGGIEAAIVSPSDSGTSATPTARMGSDHRLETPRAYQLPDESWFLAAFGCATVPRSDEVCDDQRVFFFELTPDGEGRELGSFADVEQSTFVVVGSVGSDHVVIDLQHNDVPSGEHAVTDDVVATYTERYILVSTKDGAAETVPWNPPPLTYSPISATGVPGSVRPDRSTCVLDGALHVIDTAPDGDGLETTLTIVPIDTGRATTAVVELPKGQRTSASFCREDASALSIAVLDEDSKSALAYGVGRDGMLGEGARQGYDGEIVAFQVGPRTALLRVVDKPDAGSSRFYALVEGNWQQVDFTAEMSDQASLSADGTAVLIQRGLEYRALSL